MTRKRAVVAVALVALVALAGCNGGPGSGGTGTADGDGDQSPRDVRNETIAAMEDIETYRVEADQKRTISANIEQTSTVDSSLVVDRPANRLRARQNTSVRGRTVTVETYIVDRTLYQHSDSFTSRYGSEWIEVDPSGNFSRTYSALDTLERHRELLSISTVELNGTETVDGTETRVLEADPDPEELERIFGELFGNRAGGGGTNVSLEVNEAAFTFWVSTESDLPLKAEGQLNATISAQGRSYDQNQSLSFRYTEYGANVSITLPDGAEDAVDAGAMRPAATDRLVNRVPARP